MIRNKRKGPLSGKVAIVTGATSGIGSGVAERLAEDGASVVVCGRDRERGNSVVARIAAAGGRAEFVECDVTVEQQIAKLAKETLDRFARIDILFNNAGVFFTSSVDETTSEMWDSAFAVNTRAYFLLAKYCLPSMVASGSGVILNNASVAGMQSYASGRSYAYSASKAAVVQLTRILALNYGKDGIRVNAICPGIIETPLFGGRDLAGSVSKIPLGRLGQVSDVASLASFLASAESSFITGAVIPVDGGLSI